jgi:hypothetical protein
MGRELAASHRSSTPLEEVTSYIVMAPLSKYLVGLRYTYRGSIELGQETEAVVYFKIWFYYSKHLGKYTNSGIGDRGDYGATQSTRDRFFNYGS